MALRLTAATLAFCLVALPALHAGRLDLETYSSIRPPARDSHAVPAQRGVQWVPGDARYLRDEGPWTRTISPMGYTGFAAAGLAQGLSRHNTGETVGFGLVTVLQALSAYRSVKPQSSSSSSRR